jgi:hypothetical protein
MQILVDATKNKTRKQSPTTKKYCEIITNLNHGIKTVINSVMCYEPNTTKFTEIVKIWKTSLPSV